MQGSCADVNSPYKRKCWANSGALQLIHYSEDPSRLKYPFNPFVYTRTYTWRKFIDIQNPEKKERKSFLFPVPLLPFPSFPPFPNSLIRLSFILSLCSTHAHPHWKEDLIYVFPKMELRGLVPNLQIHVSVSDIYIPIYCCSKIGGPIVGIYKSLTDAWM